MKKYLIISLLNFSFLIADQEPIYSVSSARFLQNQTKPVKEEEKENPKPDHAIAAKSASISDHNEIMIIPPESRAKDILNAFQYLKKMSVGSKIAIQLTNGSLLSGINEIQLMPGGTMIIFKVSTLKGLQYRVEKIENIDTIIYE